MDGKIPFVTYVLHSDRLGLRPMTIDDLDELAALLGDPEVMAHYPRPRTRGEAADWIRWNLDLYETHGHGLWVIERLDDSAFIGDCGLTPQVVDGVTEIEVGYHVKQRLQGNGYASEAASLCVSYARDTLMVDRVVALMTPTNAASRRVAEKAGLEFDRLGDYKGQPTVVMQKRFIAM